MQKSMVQELNSLAHSTVFSSRPSFLQPHAHDGDFSDLHSSRIQNLPGYNRSDLSSRLNFVVVFQGIEIERLTQQLEGLRVRARDWQRQQINHDNFQVQIRELTERCHLYEVQKQGIEEELTHSKQFCERILSEFEQYRLSHSEASVETSEKYKFERERREEAEIEVEKWRNRFSSQQMTHSRELQQMRRQFQKKRRSSISREVRVMTANYESQLNIMNTELSTAKNEAIARQVDVQRMQEMLNHYIERERDVERTVEKMEEYENRMVLLSQENYRLNEMLRWKAEEIERLKQQLQQVQSKVSMTLESFQVERRQTEQQLNSREQQLQELTVQISHLQDENIRVQRSADVAKHQQGIIKQLESNLSTVERQYREQTNQLEQEKSQRRMVESRLETITTTTQKEFTHYEQTIINYTKQQEKLTVQLKHQQNENGHLKDRISVLQKQEDNWNDLAYEKDQLQKELGRYVVKIEEYSRKIMSLEEVQAMNEHLKDKHEKLKNANGQLASHISQLNHQLSEASNQAESRDRKIVNLQTQVEKCSELRDELSGCYARIAQMSEKIDSLSSEINTKIGQLRQLKARMALFDKGRGTYQMIEQRLVQNLEQMERLILQLDQARRQNEQLSHENMHLQRTVSQQRSEVLSGFEEKEQIMRNMTNKSNEIHSLTEQIKQLEDNIQQMKVHQQASQQYETQLSQLQHGYWQMEERLNLQKEKSYSFSVQVERLSSQIIEMRQKPTIPVEMHQQFERITSQNVEQRNLIVDLQQRLNKMEDLLLGLKRQYHKQHQLGQTLLSTSRNIGEKMSSFDDFMNMAQRLSDQLVNVRQEHFQLESQRNMADIEMCESLRIVRDDIKPPTFNPIMKNESIGFGLPPMEEKKQPGQGHIFTFKQVSKRQSGDYIRQDEPLAFPSKQISSQEDVQSMEGTIINTLLTKQSGSRFERSTHTQDERHLDAFGANRKALQNTQPLRAHSPQVQRNIQTHFHVQRKSEQPEGGRLLVGTAVNRQDEGSIKRVSSYSNFVPYFQSPRAEPAKRTIVERKQGAPGIRVLSAISSQNSVREGSPYGKTIRIPLDPTRLSGNT